MSAASPGSECIQPQLWAISGVKCYQAPLFKNKPGVFSDMLSICAATIRIVSVTSPGSRSEARGSGSELLRANRGRKPPAASSLVSVTDGDTKQGESQYLTCQSQRKLCVSGC